MYDLGSRRLTVATYSPVQGGEKSLVNGVKQSREDRISRSGVQKSNSILCCFDCQGAHCEVGCMRMVNVGGWDGYRP